MRRHLAISGIALLLARGASAADPFYMGGDVSLLPFIESRGGQFRDNGVVKPADRIMVERGANLFRLRLFVNPNTSYAATNGAIQDLNSTIALAQRLKASGAKVLLDYHYSDTWADPGQQAKPAAWAGLSAAALRTQVRTYTRDSLQAFRAAGVMPDMVQVGNEITHGMLWPTGQIVYTGSTQAQNASWQSLGGLINSAIAGVRDVDAQIAGQRTPVAIHIDGGSVQGRAQYYFGQLTNVAGVDPASYEIAGLSFYPTTAGALANLQANLNHAATTTGRQVMVLEAGQPWKGAATGAAWPSTAAGQRDFLLAVRDAVRAVPNGRGLGALWWYPESIQVPGVNIYKGGSHALFDDSGGDALPALDAFDVPTPTWTRNGDGAWSDAAGWTSGTPGSAGQTARFGRAISSARMVTLDTPRTVGRVQFISPVPYTLAGTHPLTLDNGSSAGRIDVLAGQHQVLTPITFAGDGEINAAWEHRLTLSGPVTMPEGSTLTKLGSGTARIDRVRADRLHVAYGTLEMTSQADAAAGVPAVVRSLTVLPRGTIDLAGSALVIEPAAGVTAALHDDVRALLAAGRLTSALAGGDRAVGYATIGGSGLTAFDGRPIGPASLMVRLALRGDTNLDHRVDFADLLALAQRYGTTAGGTWSQGDGNYDGAIDFADLLALAQTYGSAADASVSPMLATLEFATFRADFALAQSLVPEPLGVAPVLTLLVATARRSRRSRRQC